MRSVNASELERLKKRFMKLDRYAQRELSTYRDALTFLLTVK